MCLIYHPHIISIACIYLAAYHLEKLDSELTEWFENLSIDLVEVSEVVQELLSLYSMWEDDLVFTVGAIIRKTEAHVESTRLRKGRRR